MAAIIETVAWDKRMTLGCEELTRLMPFGTNWNSIRIGVRFAVWGGAIGSVLAGGINVWMWMGVCEGPNGPQSNYCEDYVGAGLGGPGRGAYTIDTTKPETYLASSTNVYGQWMYKGSWVSTIATTGFGTPRFSAVPPYLASVWFVDLTKATGSMGFATVGPSTGVQARTSWNRTSFLQAMGTTAVPPNTAAVAGPTVTYSGNNRLNHLSVIWGSITPQIEIFDIAVSRRL